MAIALKEKKMFEIAYKSNCSRISLTQKGKKTSCKLKGKKNKSKLVPGGEFYVQG